MGKQVTAGKEVWEVRVCPGGQLPGRARSQRGEATVPFRPLHGGGCPWRRRGRAGAGEKGGQEPQTVLFQTAWVTRGRGEGESESAKA